MHARHSFKDGSAPGSRKSPANKQTKSNKQTQIQPINQPIKQQTNQQQPTKHQYCGPSCPVVPEALALAGPRVPWLGSWPGPRGEVGRADARLPLAALDGDPGPLPPAAGTAPTCHA